MATDPRLAIQQHLAWCARAYGPELALALPVVQAAPAAPVPEAPVAPAGRSTPEAAPRSAVEAPTAAEAPADAETPADVELHTPPAAGAPAAGRAATDGPKQIALQELRHELTDCTRCKLSAGRQHVVFGEGNPDTRVLFIGEAPGAREDQTGRPFVGPAGQLLDRILAGAMGLQRSDVYIANVNKCRPPGNRAPEADEVAACLPFLRRQVEILAPEVIVCLGRTAAQNLLGSTESTTALRGREHRYAGIPVVVTWHPAYLLRDPSKKRETWEDIKRVNRLLGLPDVPS